MAAAQKPKEPLNTLIKEKGGEIYARSVAYFPCDSRQMSYAREKKHMKDSILFTALCWNASLHKEKQMFMCKM